jgi:ACT domain-containing protein
VFKSASLVRVVEAENIMEAAEKVGLSHPKMSKYENLVWQWFVDGEQSYAIEVCEQE